MNQESTSEKNHQVAMMLEIYKRAIGVHIWLGETFEPMMKERVDIFRICCHGAYPFQQRP